MATGFSAVRSGIVMFIIPFVFAMYPELLLIEAAVEDPSPGAAGSFLPGYDGKIHVAALFALIARLMLALYLVASALANHDHAQLNLLEVALRLLLAGLAKHGSPIIYGPAIVAALIWLAPHFTRNRRYLQHD